MAQPSDDEATSAGSPREPAEEAEQLVSLAAELSHLGDAVSAATLLSQAVTEGALSTAEATVQAPSAVTAVLGLVHARIMQLRRVLHGAEDPADILTPHNATGEPQPGDDPDVRLRPWPPSQRAAFHAQQQAAAERDEEREKPAPRRED
ncbi:hypothetical protein [Myxococcus virescens]|uniref:Uncharacterized protein n=1 Tax=Myxococcus virescens TaxID=83456 RepID=A0A511HC22_9BACT|nr:hypothetical protein [Myxococcus virescens]GEL71100.1 hypothetical protein MVI01_28840 [Myxococcus virescens]SDD86778.1 hypothetical protein SAMN04488504_1036 [Myxococcus virescens]